MRAIQGGARTQDEIQGRTNLSEHEVLEAIAFWWDANKLNRQALRLRRYIAA